MALPDFFVMGAPKAGTTALHAALTQHPQLFLPNPKETKFYLTGERRPPRSTQRGPGDAHSAQEWIWRRKQYEALFEAAPAGKLRGESTPFYLYDLDSHRRIADDNPRAKLIVVIRDPIDRAYSNWMHLRSDGLEPIADFAEALAAEDERVERGFAPFWHYSRLGMYGEQLDHLYKHFPREQVHVLRYRDLVNDAAVAVDAVCEFLGVETGRVGSVPRENSRPYVDDTPRHRALSRVARGGAWLGSFAPPQVWRRASVPLLRALHTGDARRPVLDPAVRAELVKPFAEDNALLARLLERDFSDWLGATSRGQFQESTR
ncbi:sulfotransferase family protein [Spongisporangium articulatum]|uniref:Sulfotransferase family protein n=1 Tax=Spongisporangium articulatum TaxID=3362603 RepID=A0ABW8AN11_9ACTN